MVASGEKLGFLPEENLKRFIDVLIDLGEVYAPKTEGDVTDIGRIHDSTEVSIDFEQTRGNLRSVVEPQNEILLTYKQKSDSFCEESLPEKRQRIVLWCRPCDARAISFLDDNFNDRPMHDPYYDRRREDILLIGLGCSIPFPFCFCRSIGGSPFGKDNLDILMTRTKVGYILDFLTERGRDIKNKLGDVIVNPSTEQIEDSKDIQHRAESAQQRKAPDVSTISKKAATDLFSFSAWKKWGDKCIGCGICTYLCPTCWCFDITDMETKGKGYRIRTWDSCQFPLFTLHTSSHNPRPDKASRVRQRVLHKFNYHPSNYDGRIACVGCGRCSELCPMDIDLISILEDIAKEGGTSD